MIPILYSKTETNFSTNGLGRLSDAVSCIVTEERNGIFELEMVYPMTGVHFADIQVDNFIKTICNAKKDHQLFRIYMISKPINGKCTIKAEHISYQMLHIPLMPFSAVGAAATFAAIPDHVVGDCPFTFYTNNTSTRRYSLHYPKSLRGALQGDQWSILQNFGGDYEWDNWTIRLLTQRGEDKGVILRYGKNIVDLKQEENIQQTYTGIVPFWYGYDGEEQKLVTLPEQVLYAPTAGNFPYTRVLTVDFTDQLEGQPTEVELRAAGQAYIQRNEIGYPAVSISLSFVDLSQTEEYKDLPVDTLNLCDVITVIFSELGVSKKAKITRTKYDPLTERYTNLYIGESYHSLASIIAEQTVATREIQEAARTATTKALQLATSILNGDITGSRMITLTDSAGNPQGLIFMDTDDPTTAQNCIRINTNGIGFSNSGPSGPYASAWTIDNTLNMENINVVNLVSKIVRSLSADENILLEIMSSYLDVREKVNDEWRQRIGLYMGSGGIGSLRVSSGAVDANGSPIQGEASSRAFIQPNGIWVGLDENGFVQGTIYAKNISGLERKTLATSNLTAVDATWTFSINNINAFVVRGRTGSADIYTCVVPVAAISTSDTLYGWTDSTGTTQFAVKLSGTTCTVTLKAIPSGGRLLDAYSII